MLNGKTTRDITNEYGEQGLENKKKPGNPLCKYSNKKNLTDIEKLQYENMKNIAIIVNNMNLVL